MKPRNLCVKLPLTEEACRAAIALIQGAGYYYPRTVEYLMQRRHRDGANEVAIRGGSDGDSGQSGDLALYDTNKEFGTCKVIDLRDVFPPVPKPVTLSLRSKTETFTIVVGKTETKVGCQTFDNITLLPVLDQVREAVSKA